MPDYILAYLGGGKPPASPEEGQAHMARWKAWLEDLGDAVVNPGTPLGPSWRVNADGATEGGGATPLTGFSVIRADNIEAALAIAKACPFVEMGTLEVAEMKQMPGG